MQKSMSLSYACNCVYKLFGREVVMFKRVKNKWWRFVLLGDLTLSQGEDTTCGFCWSMEPVNRCADYFIFGVCWEFEELCCMEIRSRAHKVLIYCDSLKYSSPARFLHFSEFSSVHFFGKNRTNFRSQRINWNVKHEGDTCTNFCTSISWFLQVM